MKAHCAAGRTIPPWQPPRKDARPTPGSRSSRSTPRTTSRVSSSSSPASTPSPAAPTRTCTAAGRGRSGSTPGSRSAEETNQRFRYLLDRGQTGLSVAFDLPTQLGYDSDDTRARRRGGADRRRDRLDRRHGAALRRHPAERGLDLDDDQRAGGAAAPALRARRGGAGRVRDAAARHGPERRPQGVLRARQLHLPAAADHADHDRPVRVLPRAAAALQHDLDLRLPHPRGRLDGGAGARVHPRERDRLRAGRGRRGALARRVRRAALVLLQRPQPLLPGDREVPRGAAAVGADHEGALRRDEPEGDGAPVPRADRRLDADCPAAGEQHRPRRGSGALGRGRRRPVDPHERVRRGAGPPDGAVGQDRAQDAAGPRPRGGRHRHGRSVRRLVLHRGADDRARGGGVGADRAGRRDRRRGCGDRAGLRPARDRGRGVPLPARGRAGRARHRRRQPLPGARARADRAPPARSGGRAPAARADGASPGRAGRRGRRPSAGGGSARGAHGREPAACRCGRRCGCGARWARSARSCARSSGRTTPSGRSADPPRLADVPGARRPRPRRVRPGSRGGAGRVGGTSSSGRSSTAGPAGRRATCV